MESVPESSCSFDRGYGWPPMSHLMDGKQASNSGWKHMRHSRDGGIFGTFGMEAYWALSGWRYIWCNGKETNGQK